MKPWLARHFSIWWLVAIPLCGCSCEMWLMLHRAQVPVARVGQALDWWFDCRANPACLTSKVQATMGAVSAAAGQSAIASKETVATLRDLHPRANTVLDETAATIRTARETLVDVHGAVVGMRGDLHDVLRTANDAGKSADTDLRALESVLRHVDALTVDLQQQVRDQAPTVKAAAGALQRSLDDLDHVLADPNISATLANVGAASGHLDESAKSVDIALRPWREKAHLLKTIVSKAIGLIHVTVPLW